MNTALKTTTLMGSMMLGIASVIFAQVPDLTKDTQAVDRNGTYNLGATGLRGWIYTKAANNLDAAQGRTTIASRQILVTHVGTNTPAFGIVEVNDAILGVGDTPFSDDARKCFGRAITEAEKTENKGVMKLILFRSGDTKKVQLTLPVLGTYSESAPYNCKKSARILADAVRNLEKETLPKNLWGAINGLALLATGNQKVLPKVQAFARSFKPQLNPDACDAWDWGYVNLFLCEYYLATGDQQVLPAIREYTVNLAKAQGLYGTFGHGGSARRADGGFNGAIPAYGPVNQSGLSANLGLVMGYKCKIREPEIAPAIYRAAQFFKYYVGKGSVPYGEHIAWHFHENNGKNALAAVLFSAIEGQPEAQRYYARMAVAGFPNREYGHTGQGFSYLWSMLGANVGGPKAAAAFMKENQWHLDLVRRCDGSFTYDGAEQYGPGTTDDNTYWGRSSYNGLSPNACYVLSYAVPLRKLHITGKNAKETCWLSRQDVAACIASGRFDLDCKKMSKEELLKAFDDWSPIVRSWAAAELASRPEARALEAELLNMAEGKNPRVQEATCETLGLLKSTQALPLYIKFQRSDNRWLRVKAAMALEQVGDAARPALPEMLKAIVDTAEPAVPPSWDDPIQFAQGQLARTVFQGQPKKALDDCDRQLLYSAIRVVGKNPSGHGRGNLAGFFAKQLTEADVRALGPELLAAVNESAPADRMFADGIRQGALQVLVKYRFQEGIPLCLKYARTQSQWGSQDRIVEIMKLLEGYGVHAKEALPELKKLAEWCRTEPGFPDWARNKKREGIEAAIQRIEAMDEKVELKSMADRRTD